MFQSLLIRQKEVDSALLECLHILSFGVLFVLLVRSDSEAIKAHFLLTSKRSAAVGKSLVYAD